MKTLEYFDFGGKDARKRKEQEKEKNLQQAEESTRQVTGLYEEKMRRVNLSRSKTERSLSEIYGIPEFTP